MFTPQVEIQLLAMVVAAVCALPGVFLLLREMAMMSDAISHAILPGIVVGFFLTGNINSPLLLIMATLAGLLTVALVEAIYRTGLVKEDAAIGIVFPALFSVGVILIAYYAGDVHLDTDAVLLGEIAFAPFDRWVVGGVDLGPQSLYVMGAVGVINAAFIAVFYKELKLATFDAGLAAAFGFLPTVLHYVLMGLVSMTAVAAFDAVGSILVIALMVGPPATAHLLTDRLPQMIGLSIGVGIVSALSGYWVARVLDASIAGAMAAMVGLCFALAFLLAPERGLLAQWQRRRQQRWTFATQMLTIHLVNHEGTPHEPRESRVAHLQEHLGWTPDKAHRVVRQAVKDNLVRRTNGHLTLTESGRQFADRSVTHLQADHSR